MPIAANRSLSGGDVGAAYWMHVRMRRAICCRRSRPGATRIFARPARRSRRSRRTFATGSSWCCCWRSSPANSCRSRIAARCASTNCRTSTRRCSLSRARACVLCPSAPKVGPGAVACEVLPRVTGQLADKPTRGLDISRTGQLAV